jgi:hypothetical protein
MVTRSTSSEINHGKFGRSQFLHNVSGFLEAFQQRLGYGFRLFVNLL